MNRKASEVILDLESKIDRLISLSENNKLMLNILSNKLNSLIKENSKIKENIPSTPVFAEAVDVKSVKYNVTKPDTIPIDIEDNVNIDTHPHGHRRVSRHEVYTGKNSFSNVNKSNNIDNKELPIQVPHGKGVRVVNPNTINEEDEFTDYNDSNQDINPNNAIPVMQRVVYDNGKAVFMAEVNILSLPELNKIDKSRTSGVGKWSATLKPGKYRALIKHRNRITKESSEKTFDFIIDGKTNPIELDPVIF